MLVRLAILASVLTVASCARDYGVAVRNLTSEELLDAQVSFGDFRSLGGKLNPGIYKIEYEIGHPVPDDAVVRWVTSDRRVHTQTVSVQAVVPRNFSGRIFFEIMPDQTVRVRAREELPPITTNPEP